MQTVGLNEVDKKIHPNFLMKEKGLQDAYKIFKHILIIIDSLPSKKFKYR